MIRRLRWGRILLGGLFSELAIFAVFVPLQSVYGEAVTNLVPVLAVVTAFLFGWWAAKAAHDRQVLHGTLVAVAASLMWIALVFGAGGEWSEIPVLYHVTHGLRIMGGAAGGWWAARRVASLAPPANIA
jgi:putative membrane protein (TIGR04086 family)